MLRHGLLLGAVVGALAAAAVLAPLSSARTTQTYCQKARSANHGILIKKVNGVTVYRVSRTVYACSDLKRKDLGLYFPDAGYKVSQVKASNSRCVAILFTSNRQNQPPEILFKDVAGREIGSSISQPGYGQPASKIGSLAVSSNCTAAWGQSVTDSAGTTTYSIVAKGFGAATDVIKGLNPVATVTSADDIAHVTIRSSARKAIVGWTQAGARQSKTMPAAS